MTATPPTHIPAQHRVDSTSDTADAVNHEHQQRDAHDIRGNRGTKRLIGVLVALLLIVALAVAGVFAVRRLGGLPWEALSANTTSTMPKNEAEKKYPKAVSGVDFNDNGIDDYADILAGARRDAQAHPTYDGGYYEGGYPPSDRGACTDVVWRAFREAGYDLKSMVDADIASDPAGYEAVAPKPDPNIDFRRTGVLDVFFAKYGQSLTTDVTDYGQWQGGDIVVFENVKHIGVISDKRDAAGTSYVLHNMNQEQRENDYLAFSKHMKVTGHYRFDAAKVPQTVLKAWSL
jgi:uncharacterized protein YijF (DUF1287 family)